MYTKLMLPISGLLFLFFLSACNDQSDSETATTTGEPGVEAPAPEAETVQQASETAPTFDKEVLVFAGTDAVTNWLDSEQGWGGLHDDGTGGAPYALFTAINPSWSEVSKTLQVERKKQLFYRFLLPLVLHANKMVRERRAQVLEIQRKVVASEALDEQELALLRHGLVTLRVIDAETAASVTALTPELGGYFEQLLYRLDEFPAGLALGQAAYESGYGTSRFALAGNALFGQWTWGDDGIKPKEQRTESHGNHRIAAYDWPFDSVRSYFINLMSHPSYEDLRRLRADLRAKGEPLDSLVMADGLIRYSERGQVYVDELKAMIRRNGLERADHVELRDENMRFLVVAADAESAAQLEAEIAAKRESGELEEIYERMRLD